MSAEECMEADITDMQCLTLCIGMLERVHGVCLHSCLAKLYLIQSHKSFEDNSTLEGVLADLIIPSVKRKELAMREKGLICLGLCCLIAKVVNIVNSDHQLTMS